jgi:predicted PurR-regulated permease PerM
MSYSAAHRTKLAERYQADRRVRKLRRLWWSLCDDLGHVIAGVIGLALAVGVCGMVWLAVIQLESWLR